MTEKHMPGPWQAKPTGPWDGWDGWSVEGADEQVVCDVRGSQWDGTRAANARLIAAAPDLLDALCIAVSYMPQGDEQDRIADLIAKAGAAVFAAKPLAPGLPWHLPVNVWSEPERAALADPVRVACVTLDGTTLTVPVDQIGDVLHGEDDQHTYTLTLKTITRAEFEALGDFNGF